jgi:hypothetical protein
VLRRRTLNDQLSTLRFRGILHFNQTGILTEFD